jgi:alpha-aminoadipic semialdehyde synthase
VRYLTRGGDSPETDPQVRETLHRATIVRDGELTEKHAWLASAVQGWRGSSSSSTGQAEPSDSGPRRAAEARPTKKKVLLLGSGLVAGPAVEVFAARKDVHLVIGRSGVQDEPDTARLLTMMTASNNLAEANGLIRNHENVEAFNLDISDADKLEQAVSNADVVVRCARFQSSDVMIGLTRPSLLPAPMHTAVARHCIRHARHLITASYISPEMKALDQA